MLEKLIKYDLKYLFKNMIIFYILAIFFAIITRLLFSLNQTVFIKLIGQISVGCMFSMVGSILFNNIIRSWVRFRDNLYKDEAYLTHTLPVTKNCLYTAKFMESFIFTLCNFVIIVIALFITYYTEERWLLLKNSFNSLMSDYNLNIWFLVISIIVIFFLEIVNIIQTGYLGIIMGHKQNNNKIAFSFLFGFITYLLSQGLVILVLFVIGLFNSSIMDIFTSSIIMSSNTIKFLIFFAIIIYMIIIFIMSLLCKKELSSGIDVL